MKKIRLLREAGGVGDVIRVIAVASALKRKYQKEGCWIRFYTFGQYKEICDHCPSIDETVAVDDRNRRQRDDKDFGKYPYLQDGIEWDETWDLFCPAYIHEVETKGAVTLERTELFCQACGVEVERPVYVVTLNEMRAALHWFGSHGIAPRSAVGIQPFATHGSRRWPLPHWARLTQYLYECGIPVVAVDAVRRIPKDLRCITFTNKTLSEAIAITSQLGYLITPDSGFFHVAGVLGIPCMGIFGSTSGPVMNKFYPTCSVIQARDPGRKFSCHPPCYGRRERGYPLGGSKGENYCHNRNCLDSGFVCQVMADLPPETVWQAVKTDMEKWGVSRGEAVLPSAESSHLL